MNNQLNLIILSLVLVSCAALGPKKELKKEIDNGEVSVGSVLDLSRSSYLKGCVDGIKYLTKKETKGVVFEYCRTKAKLHEDEIKEILK